MAHARTITSNITGQVSGINLFTNPEELLTNWTFTNSVATANVASSPDDTTTADRYVASNAVAGEHSFERSYSLTAFETFDSGAVTFDTSNETFDTGSPTVGATQTFTSSLFIKSNGSQSARFQLILDDGTAAEQNIFFDVNLNTGIIGSLFTPQGGVTGDAFGVVPYGNGWYRIFITATFSFGFSSVQTKVFYNSSTGASLWTGDGTTGVYAWGAKFNKGALDPYTAVSGEVFYSDNEFNIKTYALGLLEDYLSQAIQGTLVSPSTNAGFYRFYDSTAASDYTIASIDRISRFS